MAFDLIGGGKKTSSSVSFRDEKIGAADNALVNAPKSTVSGKNNRINAAYDHGVAVNGQNNTVTVTTTDNGTVSAALDLARDSLLSQANLAVESIGASNATNERLKDLAETRATDGGNITQRTILYVILGLAGLWALTYLLRK